MFVLEGSGSCSGLDNFPIESNTEDTNNDT